MPVISACWSPSCRRSCGSAGRRSGWPRQSAGAWRAQAGSSPHRIIVSILDSASRGFAWTVVSDPVVARVHRLQHVQRFLAADLADDDAVGAHTRELITSCRCRIAPCPRRWAAASRAGRRAPLQLQFTAVFDGDDPLALGDETGQHVQQRRLAGAGASLISMFSRFLTQCSRNSSIGRVSEQSAANPPRLEPLGGNRRIEAAGRHASGGMITLTRDPSAARVHHRRAVVDRRPAPLTIRSMTRIRCLSSGTSSAAARAYRCARRRPA